MTRVLLLVATGLVVAACGTGTIDSGEPTTSGPKTEPTSSTTSGEFTVPSHLSSIAAAWETDFTNSTIDLNELLVGIPASDPRDMIRPIDEPVYDPASNTTWLGDNDPGVLLAIEGDVRFFPLSILNRHEIVNDTVGGIPVAVTYCPLCNTAVVFDRRLGADTLRLGVSGLLRNSDLVMWDNVTQTLWQQINGQAIVGENAGEHLTIIPAGIVRWADFIDQHPAGLAMTDNQGLGSNYGSNPYEFYSSRATPYGFFTGEIDDRFPALERVVGVTAGDEEKAYPFSIIAEVGTVNDELGDIPIVVFWGAPETADALDSFDIASSRGIGTAIAFDPVVDGVALTFETSGDGFVDDQTGSWWTILGKAIDGELAGSQLDLISHRNEFWFAWQAFFPEAEVWAG